MYFYLVKENEDIIGTTTSVYPLNMENHIQCTQEEYIENGGFIPPNVEDTKSISDAEKVLNILLL